MIHPWWADRVACAKPSDRKECDEQGALEGQCCWTRGVRRTEALAENEEEDGG